MRKTETKTKLKSNQKGITLIALVITIIVLLILAGVAISMLAGDNGILKQAAEAKTKTEEKSLLEQVQLAAMDALMRGTDPKSIESKEILRDALESQGLTVNDDDIDGNATEGYTVTAKEKTYKVAANGTVREKSIVTDITATNYGDVISGYSKNGVSDWKVFLNDGKNVWIMASDYVKIDDTTKTKAGMSTSDYYAWWVSAPTKYTGNNNAKCAASLADTENWEEYVDKDLAEKAMGGPDIKMFADSYNAKYQEETGKSLVYKLDSKVGWKNNGASEADVTYYSYEEGLKNDGFYYLSSPTKAYAYWLASPSAYTVNNYFLMSVSYERRCG